MPSSDTSLSPLIKAERIWRLAAVMLLGATILAIVVLAYTPPVSRDALNHHLALPKLYLQNGGIFELPDRVFSYYPMNLDLLYMIPLYMGSDIFAKYMHFTFGLLTAMLLFQYISRRMGRGYGLFGVLLFLSTPIVVKLSTTVYVDLGLTFFSTAALLVLFKWYENGFHARHLILSSVCCGLALGTKYHGLVVFFILTNMVLMLYVKRFGLRRSGADVSHCLQTFKIFLIYIGIALILFSPWMYRNMLWKSNPLYPLFNSTFQSIFDTPKSIVGTGSTVLSENHQKQVQRRSNHNHFTYRAIVFEESGLEIALIPLRIFFQGQDGNPKYFDGVLNPLLLLLPLFAFTGFRRGCQIVRVEKVALLFFALLMIAFVFLLVDMRVRYILPAIPPLTILSAYGLKSLLGIVTRLSAGVRQHTLFGLVGLLIAGLLFQNVFYIAGLYKYVRPFSYISGKIGRDDYIAQFRPDISVHRYASRHLGKDAKILGLFLGYRSYYSDRTLVFGDTIFKNAVIQSLDTGEISRHLRSKGLTHLLIRHDLFDQWVGNNFSGEEKERIRQFFSVSTIRLYAAKIYGLHTIGTR